MTSRNRILTGLLSTTALMSAWGAMDAANAAACTGAFVMGDVFASVGSSTVDVFTPTGALVCTLNDASGSSFTTGSGFDAAGNFYVTNFSTGNISKFNDPQPGLVTAFMTGTSAGESIDNQSTGFYALTSLVGQAGAAAINKYNTATGALIHSYSVTGGNLTGGTDWVDVYNPTTGQVIYDGEGTRVLSAILNANGTTTQLAAFTPPPPRPRYTTSLPCAPSAPELLPVMFCSPIASKMCCWTARATSSSTTSWVPA
jgi:hypothetical protein